MPKIYLSPAYHKWNPCAIPGCDETTHNNLYLDELEPFLKASGIEYKRGPRRVPKSNEDGTALMNNAIKESNAYRPDIHYVSHTNAANGTVRGYRPMIYPGSTAARRLAGSIIKFRTEIYNQPINLKETAEWAELRETVAVAYYEEHVFHDNANDAKWFHDNLRSIARQTCKGFCEYLGIRFVEPYEGQPAPAPQPSPTPQPSPAKIDITYQTWDDVRNRWLPNVKNTEDYAGIFGHDVCAVYASLSSGNITYAVHIKGGRWLPEVKNRTDYAGLFNQPIDALMMKTDTGKNIRYCVHLRKSNRWLPWVTGYNKNDHNNGYAGIIGMEIDAIRAEVV